ncbi:ABC transporter substrate-binding protein [Nonomuraea terrae]|uniref:ABC transporter substrate-binding protein n=1 Tax=Nonomuraea terrae TaxID=2530383 RepID=UPI0037A489BF
MNEVDRRGFLKLALAGAAAVGLAGCGGGDGAAGGATSLRYAWWGNNVRQQNYTKALKEFSAKNPDIQVEPEFAEYEAFQERMTTQMAARDVADIFWIASAQVMTYARNNLYRDLQGIPTLDLSAYDSAALESFKLDGKLNTMPFGIFVPVIRWNQSFAEEDGVELPSGEGEWTWDAWAELLVDYTKDNPKGRKGSPYEADADLPFEAWLRQRGEQLWTQDGRIGFTVDGVSSWFDWWEKLLKAGAVLTLSEQEGMSPDWTLVGEKVLGKVANSNHIIDDAKMFPDHTFAERAVPIAPGAQAGHKFLYYPRMAIYQGIDADKVEAAGKLIDYNTNTVEMLKVVGLTMGAPVNPEVLKQAYDFASADETEMLKVVQADQEAERRPRYEAPPGTNTWRTAMARVAEEIALGRTTVPAGSARFIEEVQAGIDRAK